MEPIATKIKEEAEAFPFPQKEEDQNFKTITEASASMLLVVGRIIKADLLEDIPWMAVITSSMVVLAFRKIGQVLVMKIGPSTKLKFEAIQLPVEYFEEHLVQLLDQIFFQKDCIPSQLLILLSLF